MDTAAYTGMVTSSYFYPPLWKPKSLQEQIRLMYRRYPYLRSPDFHDITLQGGDSIFDGIFVIPKLTSLASTFRNTDPFGGDYIFMIQNFPILAFLQQQRRITVSLGNEQVVMTREAKSAIERLERQYESDYFFVTAQTGLKFAGVSPLLATQSIVSPEFPLPLWCVIHILLTHLERLTNWDSLGIYCAGDLIGGNVFSVPYIRRIFDGRIVIETGARAEGILGVATGTV